MRRLPVGVAALVIMLMSAVVSGEEDKLFRTTATTQIDTLRLRVCKATISGVCEEYELGEVELVDKTSESTVRLLKGEGKALVRMAIRRGRDRNDGKEKVCFKVREKGGNEFDPRCVEQASSGDRPYLYPTVTLEFNRLDNGEVQLVRVRVNDEVVELDGPSELKNRVLVVVSEENPVCYLTCRVGGCVKYCR